MLFTLGNTDFDPDVSIKVALSKLYIPELFDEEKNIFSMQRIKLKDSESLFIIFQSVISIDGGVVLIGSSNSDFFISARMLLASLSCWISDSFKGNLYLYSALNEAENTNLENFAGELHKLLDETRTYKGEVYFASGDDSERIPCLGTDAWSLANA